MPAMSSWVGVRARKAALSFLGAATAAPTAAIPHRASPLPEEEEEALACPWAALRSVGPRLVLGAVTKAEQPAAASAATATCWAEGAMVLTEVSNGQTTG